MQRAYASTSPATAFLIVPAGAREGKLEDLILRVLADNPAVPCHEDFFECLGEKEIDLGRDYDKRKVQALLAAIPSKSIARNIGEAAERGKLIRSTMRRWLSSAISSGLWRAPSQSNRSPPSRSDGVNIPRLSRVSQLPSSARRGLRS